MVCKGFACAYSLCSDLPVHPSQHYCIEVFAQRVSTKMERILALSMHRLLVLDTCRIGFEQVHLI